MTAGANVKFVILTRSVCAGASEGGADPPAGIGIAAVADPLPDGTGFAVAEPPHADISRMAAVAPPTSVTMVRFGLISLCLSIARMSFPGLVCLSRAHGGPKGPPGQQ